MARTRLNLMLFAANILIPVGLAFFNLGLFRRGTADTATPLKVNVTSVDGETADTGPAPFDRVVFMVADALRSDFLYTNKSGFNFAQGLIRSGAAVPFTARAASPTLTLPRVKALTQGTGQTFLDVLLNIANSEDAVRQDGVDSWLSRLKTERDPEKNMVFYGDKTWLLLYPEIFDRYDGVEDFYIPDFDTIDQNITRHVSAELERDDWKALVMHFPGIDHVGHMSRQPHCENMILKHGELDDVVRKIYTAMQHEPHLQNTLFVLAGDHGMNERGNHGGSSPGEIASAMAFISPRLRSISEGLDSPVPAVDDYEYYSVVEQVDIVPTLAGLLGFSIPAHSLGMFIPDFVPLFRKPGDGIRVLLRNAEQIMGLFEAKKGTSGVVRSTPSCDIECRVCATDEERVSCLWEKVSGATREWQVSHDAAASEQLTQSIEAFVRSAQKHLDARPAEVHATRLAIGISCVVASMVLLVARLSLTHDPWNSGVLAFGSLVGVHAVTMFIVRLVDEDHHFCMKGGQPWFKAALPGALQFLTQCSSQSDHMIYPLIEAVDGFLPVYPLILWPLVLVTFVSSANTIATCLGRGSSFARLASSALCMKAAIFKLCWTLRYNPELLIFVPRWLQAAMLELDQLYLLKLIWTGMLGSMLYHVLQLRGSAQSSKNDTMIGVIEIINLYLKLQSRPETLMLYSLFEIQLQWLLTNLASPDWTPAHISTTTLVLAQSSFHATGAGNSVSAMDLGNGFNGVTGYNQPAVWLQTLVSNWVGPVWWSLAGLRVLAAWLGATGFGVHGAAHVMNGRKTGKKEEEVTTTANTVPEEQRYETVAATTSSHCAARGWDALSEYVTLQTLYTATGSLALMLACVWLRDDPAFWALLAPKLAYAGLWADFQQLLVNYVLCTLVWAIL
ncbi:alkaline-phosphatase-like protein [Biscogniauxia marginata]|nr:alkaline-phosphatase-like protein [Biscogniauxia marginata]